ncbi:MAG: hypothetical protein J0L84_13405 [Verrucomicrobia bacterium]|nr:hypothetical protein [Verrucomicrobiota bacterium]
MDDDPSPDAFAKGLRFACGFIAGWGAATVCLAWISVSWSSFWALGVCLSLIFGVLAMRHGERCA